MSALTERPDAPVLLVHARADIAEDWLTAHVEAAEKAYGKGFVVLPLHGLAIDASALPKTQADSPSLPWYRQSPALTLILRHARPSRSMLV